MAKTLKLLSGEVMPIVGLGTWKSKPGEVENAVKTAIDNNYKLIDCAYAYGNEEEVGRALKEKFQSGLKRQEVFITSKLWNTRHHKEDVIPSLKESLTNLNVDYLDLFLIHWPTAFKQGRENFPKDDEGNLIYDKVCHLETWKQMEECVKLGLTKSIGVSNFNSKQIQNILDNCSIKPANLQIEIHAYFGQKKLVDFCHKNGITVTAYSPLGSPDRPWAGTREEPILLKDPVIEKLGQKYSKTPGQILLKWLAQRNIAVIPKSVTPSRIQQNLNIFDFTISDEDVKIIDSIDKNYRYIAPVVEVNGKIEFRDGKAPDFPFYEEF
ncbi:DgyrCDS5806 [Dimorphilus gyrociliatus]|uniref:DgyrCDS5806 n=1 Tax=Dimorphilus gyrociliatus TaxID=2664684 RepID=A0A7I8VL39_9ANNE|nr:DgyrCDS5806 [Dimorphilus gyrociliatus]